MKTPSIPTVMARRRRKEATLKRHLERDFRQLKKRHAYLVETHHGIGEVQYVVIVRNRKEVDSFIKSQGIEKGRNCYDYSVKELVDWPDWGTSVWMSR